MKKDKLKIEKKILRLSFLGSLLFIIAEGVMAWITHSHSLLTDCLFDAADLVMVASRRSLFSAPFGTKTFSPI